MYTAEEAGITLEFNNDVGRVVLVERVEVEDDDDVDERLDCVLEDKKEDWSDML